MSPAYLYHAKALTFNNRDSSVPPVLFFRDHFPGARVRVSDNNNPYYLKKLPSYHLVSRLIKENNTGEEMRLFYVALTRAKDKLIMTGCKTDPLGTVLDNASIYSRKISKYDVKSKTNWLDWALMALSSEGIDISSNDTGIIRAHS